MTLVAPKLREFAQRLIAHEAKGIPAKAQAQASFLVAEKLRPQLAMLMGNAGFRALLARSLALASAEVSWLSDLRVKPEGSLEGLDEVASKTSAAGITHGEVILVTHLLSLLVAFIGENLTVRLVREVWPKLPLDDLHSGNRGKNEKTD